MKPFVFITLVIACFFFLFSLENANAKLSTISLQELIANSDFIAISTVTNISVSPEGRPGKAILSVEEVLKGAAVSSTVTVSWGKEVHDQAITEVGRYLLFLKWSKVGDWQSSSYGKSYWRLMSNVVSVKEYLKDHGKGCPWFAPYVYPVDHVQTAVETDISQVDVFIGETGKVVRIKAICLERIKSMIN